MRAQRILYWTVDSGADLPGAFPALEATIAVLPSGRLNPSPWSAHLTLQRSVIEDSAAEGRAIKGASNSLRERDIIMVSVMDDQLVALVHRQSRQVLEAGSELKHILDSYLNYKTAWGLQLTGSIYTSHTLRIMLARAVRRPSNQFRGIVVILERNSLEAGDCEPGACDVLDDVTEMLRESAQAAVTGAQLLAVDDVCGEFGLGDSMAPNRATRAVQLVQLSSLLH